MNRSELQTEIETIINGGQNTALVVRESLAKIADESYFDDETIPFSVGGLVGNVTFNVKGNEVLINGSITNNNSFLVGSPVFFIIPDQYLPSLAIVYGVATNLTGQTVGISLFNNDSSNNLFLRKKILLVSVIPNGQTFYFNFSYRIQ